MLEKMNLDGGVENDRQTKREKIRLKSADPRLERRQNGSPSSAVNVAEPQQRQTPATFNVPSENTTPVFQMKDRRFV